MKRIIREAAAISAVAGAMFVFVPAAGAASNGVGGCQLNGTAKFGGSGLDGPPLYGPFSYGFDGTLTNCQSSNGAPASGTVFAGEQGLNPATGAGNCGETVSSGESVVKWADGKYTVIDYKTQGALAAVGLTGTVAAATTETSTDPTTGVTTPLFSTNEAATPVGSSVGGALAFQPADPTACANFVNDPPPPGVTSAGISGVIADGNGPVATPALPAPPQLPPLPTPPIDIGPLQ
jgi:hypothetical protein